MANHRFIDPPALLLRCRRITDSGPAFYFGLAGLLVVALYITTMPHRATSTAAVGADSIRTIKTSLPVPSVNVPAAPTRVDELAGVVSRRYRVAQGAAGEVVRAAFAEGRRHGLDPLLILAVIAVESRFNPFAASDQGALGLMQIVPRFHKDKLADAGESVLSPEANIALGTRILKDAIQRGGSDAAGLQLYNGSFDDETRAYANRVLSERRRIEDALPKRRNG